MRIEQVQFPFEVPINKFVKIAFEIAVNVIRVVLVFRKGPVHIDCSHSDAPKLFRQYVEIVNKSTSPSGIPVIARYAFARYQVRRAQFLEGKLVISWRQYSIRSERGQGQERVARDSGADLGTSSTTSAEEDWGYSSAP